jgi:hypothetical protein
VEFLGVLAARSIHNCKVGIRNAPKPCEFDAGLKAPRLCDSVGASPRRSTPMPPKSLPQEQPELFRSALVKLVDPKHPLVRLAGLIGWDRFADAFGLLYNDGVGRPGLPIRRV